MSYDVPADPAWVSRGPRFPIAWAPAVLPEAPGLYAIHVDSPDSLLSPLREKLISRPDQTLIYIGTSSVNLRKRVWEEDCQHLRPATFFRSAGVMLGYVSPTGGRNFKFAKSDQERIKHWIVSHLSFAWTTDVGGMSLKHEERALIGQAQPLLNLAHNPMRIAELMEWRRRSRQGAGPAAPYAEFVPVNS